MRRAERVEEMSLESVNSTGCISPSSRTTESAAATPPTSRGNPSTVIVDNGAHYTPFSDCVYLCDFRDVKYYISSHSA